jgi:hypothetical protein
VKACPFCQAELRDSVIKCTRCGRSLLGDPDAEQQPVAARATSPGLGAPTVSGGSRGTKVGFPPPAGPAEPAAPTPWAAPPAQAARPGEPIQPVTALRALPSDRRGSGRPDVVLLLAAAATVGAAVLAWRSIGDPWVRLVITDTSDGLNPKLVGEIALHGQAALLGTIGRALAVLLGAFGLLWFVFGFDRGSTPPWFTNPGLAIIGSIVGLIGTVMAAEIWFVWQDAAVKHARAVRMTAAELRTLLELKPEPLVEVERLSGLVRFGGAMVIALLAGCGAWWSYHRRSG